MKDGGNSDREKSSRDDNEAQTAAIAVSGLEDGIWEILLNRPKRRNAINHVMAAEITAAITKITASHSARMIIIRGAGGSFCSGADMELLSDQVDLSPADRYLAETPLDDMFKALANSKLPIVTVVEGYALGGAIALIALSTYAIGSTDAVLSLPEASFGLFPGFIVPFIAMRVGASKASFWSLTSEKITPEAAQAAGLLDELVSPLDLPERVEQVKKMFGQKRPEVLRAGMQLRRLLLESQMGPNANDYGRLVSNIFWSKSALEEVALGIAKKRTTEVKDNQGK